MQFSENVVVFVAVEEMLQYSSSSDLIDGEADGVHVLAVAAELAAALLHQSHQEAAGSLVILRVIVLL